RRLERGSCQRPEERRSRRREATQRNLVIDVFKQLIRDVKSEKLRTFLTVFGIVWGTVAISLMLAFGTGLHKQLVKSTAGLGDRIVIAWPGLTSIPYEGLGKGRRIRVREEDLTAVENQVDGLKGIS